jgi:hypothetical protein
MGRIEQFQVGEERNGELASEETDQGISRGVIAH